MIRDDRIASLPAAAIAGDLNRCLGTCGTVVVTAPPGAGKSTVLPLTMLAALPEDSRILMLEPRRIAARQIAARMASLLDEAVGETVGYRIRFEKRISRRTRIEVVTEGILTRMLVEDPGLEKVAILIFDEFHERSLQTDLALALSRDAQQILRPDLKLVLMSATLDTQELCAKLGAQAISCEGSMFPVEIQYGRDIAPEEIVEATVRQIRSAHQAKEGDILAFLPGEGEIRRCAEALGATLGPTHVCPLYGMLSLEEQHRAIAPSRPGERKVVLATPIAETSLTIEGVRIVVDAGYPGPWAGMAVVAGPPQGFNPQRKVRILIHRHGVFFFQQRGNVRRYRFLYVILRRQQQLGHTGMARKRSHVPAMGCEPTRRIDRA